MHLTHPAESTLRALDAAVLSVLVHTTRPLTAADIQRIDGTATHRGVVLALERLSTHGLVLRQQVGRISLHTANRDHLLWPAVERLIIDAENAIPTLLTEVREIAQHSLPSDVTLALYGSTARGTATETSDVDLVVVSGAHHSADELDDACAALAAHVETRTGNDVHIYRLAAEDIPSKVSAEDPIVDSWLEDARTLHGPDLITLLRLPAGMT